MTKTKVTPPHSDVNLSDGVIGDDGEPATDLGAAIDWTEYDYGQSVEDDYGWIRTGC